MEAKIGLDGADKKIILHLMKNARDSIALISKKAHLSREIVNYRMQKLEEAGIITGYVARINQPLFCLGVALIQCKLTRSNRQRFDEILSFIKKQKEVNWCIETCGIFDASFTILYNTPEDIGNTTTRIFSFIGANLKSHEISLYIDEYKFDRSGLITEKETEPHKNAVSFRTQRKMEIDSLDASLIRILSENCRKKISEIARELKVTEDIVRLRIKSLERKNIITGYTLAVDANRLGFEAYQMLATVEGMSDSAIGKIKYYVGTNPYIVFCARLSGRHSIVINIHAKSRSHFSEILMGIRNAVPEIADYEFQLDMQTHKEVFVPREMIKEKE